MDPDAANGLARADPLDETAVAAGLPFAAMLDAAGAFVDSGDLLAAAAAAGAGFAGSAAFPADTAVAGFLAVSVTDPAFVADASAGLLAGCRLTAEDAVASFTAATAEGESKEPMEVPAEAEVDGRSTFIFPSREMLSLKILSTCRGRGHA